MQHETVIVLDFGGQYNQLIARRVRENNVYCEIYSYKTDLSVIKAKNPKGIIFTGGPNSVYLEDSPTIDPEIFSWGVPVLGICYGSQLMMHLLGGHVCRAPEREYGKTEVFVDNSSKMFTDVQPSTVCWMSHNDYIEQAAPGFKITAHTVNCPVAAAENEEKGLYAVQFHPEVLHTAEGKKMLHNFVYNVCGCTGDWKMDSFVENNVEALKKRIGSGKLVVITVISALLSGFVQHQFSGPWFGGLSGVVYALMGYVWLRGERDPQSGIYLQRGLILFSLVWLIAGWFDVFGMAIANGAHVAGLATGLAMAFVDTLHGRKRA